MVCTKSGISTFLVWFQASRAPASCLASRPQRGRAVPPTIYLSPTPSWQYHTNNLPHHQHPQRRDASRRRSFGARRSQCAVPVPLSSLPSKPCSPAASTSMRDSFSQQVYSAERCSTSAALSSCSRAACARVAMSFRWVRLAYRIARKLVSVNSTCPVLGRKRHKLSSTLEARERRLSISSALAFLPRTACLPRTANAMRFAARVRFVRSIARRSLSCSALHSAASLSTRQPPCASSKSRSTGRSECCSHCECATPHL
mmetsp:Transcript_28472/g.66636  ORF Transcript_28472/g.66636 Transcript_28472/m.66636 type:complete len:258 (-) Transcript_28472:1617-2390(-)